MTEDLDRSEAQHPDWLGTYLDAQRDQFVADIDRWHETDGSLSLDAYLVQAGWRKG